MAELTLSNHNAMPRNSTSTTGGARAGSSVGTSIRRNASTASKAWLGTVLQTVREGSAVTVQSLLTDLRAEGHIISAAEAEMIDDVDRETELQLDAEIDLGDEDDATLETWDEATPKLDGAATALGERSTESDGAVLIEAGLEILVDGDVCRLHVPLWAGFESRTEFGQRVMDELANRFIVLGRMADWLSKARKRFLDSADPWYLGCDAFSEMRSGHVPVSPQSFLEMSGIKTLAKPEAFSRYIRECYLIWPDATAPLSILFDVRARQAWVGNVIKQLVEGQGQMLSALDLDKLRAITKPRTKAEKQKLQFGSVDSLGFSEVLMRATLLANVGCSEVLAVYGERIIIKPHE